MAWTKKTTATGTKHSDDCSAAFGRKDQDCPRCRELLAGAPARKGWTRPTGETPAQFKASLQAALVEADRRGTVCTYGEW